MKISKIAAVIAVVALASSCHSPSRSAPAGQHCPRGWQAGVLWSTENGDSSELAYVAGDRPADRRTVPYLGFLPVPGSLEDRSGDDLIMVSNGDQLRDRTHLVTFSAADCTMTGRQVPEQLVLGVAADDGVTFTTDAFADAGAVLRRRAADGKVTAESHLKGLVLGKLLAHGNRLYAFGAGYADPNPPTQLLVLDATTLREEARVVLRGSQGTITQAVVKGEKLYYPETISKAREGTRLGIVDLASLEQSSVDLGAPAPFLVADAGGYIWVGHTYPGPAFRELTEYRWISRYDPATGKVKRFDLGIGISSIAITDSSLYVLGTQGSKDSASFRIAALPDLKLRAELDIAKPDRPGHFYPSTIVTPG
ncbi:hypothetical protein [Kribbella sp. DT2]|uniref:hypothetical protein n=1 Tax=Kribbella sp. DT2 TaxID=3393427 RepID=UPI003CEFA915